MITEFKELTAEDKRIVDGCLRRLHNGVLQKIPVTQSLDSGIRNIFMQYDRDKSGKMTINELNNFCLGIGVPLERKYTMRIMKQLDRDNNQWISLQELKD